MRDDYARRINKGIDEIKSLEYQLREEKKKVNKENENIEKLSKDKKDLQEYINRLTIIHRGNMILLISVLLTVAIKNNLMWNEFGTWFSDRAKNIYNFLLFLKNYIYFGTYNFINNNLSLGEVGATLSTVFIMILLLVGLIFLYVLVSDWLSLGMSYSNYYSYKSNEYILVKKLISLHIVVLSFIVCIVFYSSLKEYFASLNILSIWLLISAIGLMIWNIKDIVKGFRY